jgi:hypothetical protein
MAQSIEIRTCVGEKMNMFHVEQETSEQKVMQEGKG